MHGMNEKTPESHECKPNFVFRSSVNKAEQDLACETKKASEGA